MTVRAASSVAVRAVLVLFALTCSGPPAAASAAVGDAGPSVFVCYSADVADPAVLTLADAIRLGVRPYDGSSIGLPPGYWQPYAVDPRGMPPSYGYGSTQLGGYYLQCRTPYGLEDTHTAVGGSGEVYDAATVAAYRSAPDGEALGIYEVFRWGAPVPPRHCVCGPGEIGPVSDLLPSGGRALMTRIQVSGCTPHPNVPDPACTPGVALYHETRVELCAPGYPDRDAPVGGAVTLRILASYGLTGHDGYMITQLVPASLGGTNDDANLWPIRRSARPALEAKSRLENRLRHMVCTGSIGLARAQQQLARGWPALYRRLFPRATAP